MGVKAKNTTCSIKMAIFIFTHNLHRTKHELKLSIKKQSNMGADDN